MSPSESDFYSTVTVQSQLDSSALKFKSSSTVWPHRLDVVIIKVRVHIVVVVGLHAVVIVGLTSADA
jgi:hypothetical protein